MAALFFIAFFVVVVLVVFAVAPAYYERHDDWLLALDDLLDNERVPCRTARKDV